jgi:hypothetical protein
MKKKIKVWKISDAGHKDSSLEHKYSSIDFPEYQREPTVWSRAAKQRLVDSILRQFDIASLYFYKDQDGSLDCIDGRQRIGAIMSFLEENENDKEDNGFPLKSSNEVFEDDKAPFAKFDGLTFKKAKELADNGDKAGKELLDAFKEYELSIVELSGSHRSDEFNLQFIRLNLGTIINSGEKLHAMVGEIRDECFKDDGLGHHHFFDGISISTRRYSKEQVAAQILAQVFSLADTKEYTRTRHFDLQKFFKEYSVLDKAKRTLVKEVRTTLDTLAVGFKDPGILRNRAMTVSTVLLAWTLGMTAAKAKAYAAFMDEFLCRLKWQVGKGLDFDQEEYRYLMDFQRHVTQASVEKPAVATRAETLETLNDTWQAEGALPGDKEYFKRTGIKPEKACRQQ